MKVTIDLNSGSFPFFLTPTKADIDKNIEAIERAIKGKLIVIDTNYLMDIKSILMAIRGQLPEAE